jgi:hypothetical protein
MVKIIQALVLIVLLLSVACAPLSVEPKVPEVSEEPSIKAPAEQAPVEKVPEPLEEKVAGIPEARTLEPSACTSDVPPHRITHITLDVDDAPLRRTDEGFYLKVYPRDENEEVVKATVSASVHIFRTQILQDPGKPPRREKEGNEVYLDSFYRKIENVGTDCAPAELFIPFSRYREDLLIKWADDDPGFVIVKAKVGAQEFQAVYSPHEKGENVRPPQ